MVCSSHCAEEARKNWQYKKDNNITPGRPSFEEQHPDVLEDSLGEGEL